MSRLVLQYRTDAFEGCCGLCGRAVVLEAGLQLCEPDGQRPVCAACGRRAAPTLTALQGLAGAAERVGKIHSHVVCPPLTALLELARAAERFSTAAPPARVTARAA
jgi:hypothetical protein